MENSLASLSLCNHAEISYLGHSISHDRNFPMHSFPATCACGSVNLTMTFTAAPPSYAPRRCDCDFCTSRNLQYLSDPAGSLRINSPKPLQRLQQGSAQAEFLACSHCHTVVAVCYRKAEISVGAINASLLQPRSQFAEAVTVQPRLLAADTKTERWKQLWTPLVVEEGE
jgi:hypothetical protein